MSDFVDIGYTGTRDGMSEPQRASLRKLLKVCTPKTSGHHGDCVGGDAEFHNICKELGLRTVIHLPIKDQARAFCIADEYRDPLPYLHRNQMIVRECRIMLAAVPTMDEQPRGGTWYTVRYARKYREPTFLWIIRPDGSIDHQRTPGAGENLLT